MLGISHSSSEYRGLNTSTQMLGGPQPRQGSQYWKLDRDREMVQCQES